MSKVAVDKITNIAKTLQYDFIKFDTAQSSSSGSNIDFTNIPTWVKKILVVFDSVSTNGTGLVRIRLGTLTSGFFTSGYLSSSRNAGSGQGSTTGFTLDANATAAAADTRTGVIALINYTGNVWVASGDIAREIGTSTSVNSCGGTVTLDGPLTKLRITTADNFDGGTINLVYEGYNSL